MEQIGLGGSCHWCTEAIFQSIAGVSEVKQGWIKSLSPYDTYSEAVIVTFDKHLAGLETLIQIHLHTHSCTANHSMRAKYRSAIYFFSPEQQAEVTNSLTEFQKDFDQKIITQVLPFVHFRLNDIHSLNYFYSNPEKPFCKTYIHPKLKVLMRSFSDNLNSEKLKAVISSER